MKKAFYAVFGLLVTISACVHEPSLLNGPVIKFISVSTGYVKSGEADTITLSFTDGNAGIGVNSNATDAACPCIQPGNDSSCFKMDSKNIFWLIAVDEHIA